MIQISQKEKPPECTPQFYGRGLREQKERDTPTVQEHSAKENLQAKLAHTIRVGVTAAVLM